MQEHSKMKVESKQSADIDRMDKNDVTLYDKKLVDQPQKWNLEGPLTHQDNSILDNDFKMIPNIDQVGYGISFGESHHVRVDSVGHQESGLSL